MEAPRSNIVENDLFWVGNGRLIRCDAGASPNRRRPFSCERLRRHLPRSAESGTYRMAKEVGFPRLKPGGGRAGKRAPPRSRRRADGPSHGAVTREVLDVARYITDVTAQLEAAAFAAHLDQLAYFLGMAKAESEILVRINVALEAERAANESHEPIVGLPHESNSFD